MLGERLSRRLRGERRELVRSTVAARLARRRRRKGKPWARGTARGVLVNPPMLEHVHPRRTWGDMRKPWIRKRGRSWKFLS